MKGLIAALRCILTPTAPPPPEVDPATAHNKMAEETLLHAKDGYKNVQEVIKFVDTKTAVVTGLSTLIAGSLVAVLKWSIELDGESRPNLGQLTTYHCGVAPVFYVFVTLSFLSALFCIGAAVWSVIARSRPKNLENHYTILFPIYRQKDSASACSVFERKLRGMTNREILLEYEDQLRITGMIVGKKLKHIRFACFALLGQIVSFAVALALMTGMYVSEQSGPRHQRVLALTQWKH